MDEEILSPILLEYDQLLEALETQINIYKTEHNLLRNETMKLLTQNQDLHKLVDAEFERRLNVDFSMEITPIINSEMVRNLRKQLELSLKERQQLSQMFHSSQSQISQLKNQMSLRIDNTPNGNRKHEPAVPVLESKVDTLSLELKMEKSAREDEETVRLKAQTEAAKLRVLLDDQTMTLNDMVNKLWEQQLKTNGVEEENTVMRATLDYVNESRDTLEGALVKCAEKVEILEMKCEEAKKKVEEALEIAEKAVAERDIAIRRGNDLQAEMIRISQSFDHVMNESAQKLTAEVESVKINCSDKLKEVIKEMEKKDEELASLLKTTEFFKAQSNLLEIELKGRALTSEQMRILEEETIDMRSQLEFNKAQLEETKGALSDVLTENDKLIQELEAVTAREVQLRKHLDELQIRIQLCQCARLRDKLKKSKEKKTQQIVELKRQLATQLMLNEKWEKESEKLVILLEGKTQNNVKQSVKMKARNRELITKLTETKNSFRK